AAASGTAVPGGSFRYDPTPVTPIPDTHIYIVGPGEGVESDNLTVTTSLDCTTNRLVTSSPIAPPPTQLPGVAAFKVEGSFDCASCTCSFKDRDVCPRTFSEMFRFPLLNTAAQQKGRLKIGVERSASVRFEAPPQPPLPPRTCSGSF